MFKFRFDLLSNWKSTHCFPIHALVLAIYISGSVMLALGAPVRGGEIVVGSAGADVRSAPHRASEVVHRAAVGDRLELVRPERRDGYYRVRLPGQRREGWLHQSLATQLLPGAADPKNFENHGKRSSAPSVTARASSNQRHFAVGRPKTVHERVRTGYAAAVDSRLRIPLWVQYELSADQLSGPGDRDDSDFKPDETLPVLSQAQLADYAGSGFDRGHMAPAGDMKRSQAVMDQSFLLSNIAPQVGVGFNRDIWRHLEEAIRDWVRDRNKLTIITGPLFTPDNDGVVEHLVIGENQVAVPNAFFKIVVDANSLQNADALAFIIPNQRLLGERFEDYLVSIDAIEAATGVDFLKDLPDDVEEELESRVADDIWRTPQRARLLALRAAPLLTVEMVVFDENGRLANRNRLDEIVEAGRRRSPTHIFLLAHGWNNSQSEAEASYAEMLNLMRKIADRHDGLRPENFRPFIVGVHWPSKAWDEQSNRLRSASQDEDLTLAIMKTLPAEKSPETYLQDVMKLRDLLQKPPDKTTGDDFADATEIFQRYSVEPQMPEDRAVFDAAPENERSARAELRGLDAGLSIRDLFRVFTFWQMKKRAGVVGRTGGRQLVDRIQNAFPDAQIHLGGHSFGCKFWLSAVAERNARPRRAVDSMMLLQGAISAYAFASQVPGTSSPGGYRAALAQDRVRGPIIATFTDNDWPLRFAYPAGSRLAGQTGELGRAAARSPSRYAALGAAGAAGVGNQGRTIRMKSESATYGELGNGLWSIDGSNLIDGHSAIYNDHVAWLLWAAVKATRR